MVARSNKPEAAPTESPARSVKSHGAADSQSVTAPAVDAAADLVERLRRDLSERLTRAVDLFRELDGDTLKAETALRPGYVPGQIGFDPLGLAPTDPKEFRLMQEKELAHARLGMIASAGFLAQEAVTKQTWSSVYA